MTNESKKKKAQRPRGKTKLSRDKMGSLSEIHTKRQIEKVSTGTGKKQREGGRTNFCKRRGQTYRVHYK